LHQPRLLGGRKVRHRQAAAFERRLERVQVAALLGGREQKDLPDAGRKL